MVEKTPLLAVRNVRVHYPMPQARAWPWQPVPLLKAVDGIHFELQAGQTLGVVGESGCGKSTLARAIAGLSPHVQGEIWWEGKNLLAADSATAHTARRDIQMIFQDPLASLNPRMTIGNSIAEPLRNHEPHLNADQREKRVLQIMDRVGLLSRVINRYPHELSGGQCQRVGIARALILKPKLIICDEPVSALDVSVQAQVVNLLSELQREDGLSLIFIAHDLAVVKHISDRVMVMYLGRACEQGDSQLLYSDPQHPYTRVLLAAVPGTDPHVERAKCVDMLEGELPSPINPPSGCVFRTRCSHAIESCALRRPGLQGSERHAVACPVMLQKAGVCSPS